MNENNEMHQALNDYEQRDEQQQKEMESMKNWMQKLISQLPSDIVEKVKMG